MYLFINQSFIPSTFIWMLYIHNRLSSYPYFYACIYVPSFLIYLPSLHIFCIFIYIYICSYVFMSFFLVVSLELARSTFVVDFFLYYLIYLTIQLSLFCLYSYPAFQSKIFRNHLIYLYYNHNYFLLEIIYMLY